MLVKLIGCACLAAILMSVAAFGGEGEDVNSLRPDGTTALHWAVRADDLQKVEQLLRAGANAKIADRYGVTPLYLASVNGNTTMIRRLLDAGADPNSVDPAGETILMTAART